MSAGDGGQGLPTSCFNSEKMNGRAHQMGWHIGMALERYKGIDGKGPLDTKMSSRFFCGFVAGLKGCSAKAALLDYVSIGTLG